MVSPPFCRTARASGEQLTSSTSPPAPVTKDWLPQFLVVLTDAVGEADSGVADLQVDGGAGIGDGVGPVQTG